MCVFGGKRQVKYTFYSPLTALCLYWLHKSSLLIIHSSSSGLVSVKQPELVFFSGLPRFKKEKKKKTLSKSSFVLGFLCVWGGRVAVAQLGLLSMLLPGIIYFIAKSSAWSVCV